MSPLNYVWFQYRWQRLAADLFEVDGEHGLVRFWDCFHTKDRVSSRKAAAASLAPLLRPKSAGPSDSRSETDVRYAVGFLRARVQDAESGGESSLSAAQRRYGDGVIDQARVDAACRAQAARSTAGIRDMERYLADQVGDASHREITGPLLAGSGPSGVVLYRGELVDSWEDPHAPEMLFSATKSFISLMAGVAFDRGLLDPGQSVCEVVDRVAFTSETAREITWEHLLQQRSGWDGALWGKPSSVDAQSQRDGPTAAHSRPGTEWAYNDVRVNLLCVALTALFGRSIEDVLREAVMEPLGASQSWRWHGYADSHLDGIPVVVGGAHWGGGLFISAHDLALVGELCRNQGRWEGVQVISQSWFERQWTPSPTKPDYGYLWWLNRERTVFPTAPQSGVCARGNGGRHLLWIDPARELVIASHWGDEVGRLIEEISGAITTDA